MLKKLKEQVLEANLEVVRRGLVLYTFGNASGIDRDKGLVVIKPSGVDYDKLKATDMVVVDLDGKVVEGRFKPSSDTPTHLVLYRAFAEIGGIVHTHSRAATSWAQARREIPCFGTTHADYFHGPVRVTPELSPEEISEDYEANTGHAIVRRFEGISPLTTPAVLVAGHAPFVWGATPEDAARHAVILEEVAQLALATVALRADCSAISDCLHDKHFLRKHGAGAYYGQT
ncbi:MAG: L-ribulose-5-phosphate 4-epimerase [Bryobacterales bacterium]|nr:L-ribulose-5-phosphate 4-epimerase [Bryobacterales bacterium]